MIVLRGVGGEAEDVGKRGRPAMDVDARRLRRLWMATLKDQGLPDDKIGVVFDRCGRHVRREIAAWREEESDGRRHAG